MRILCLCLFIILIQVSFSYAQAPPPSVCLYRIIKNDIQSHNLKNISVYVFTNERKRDVNINLLPGWNTTIRTGLKRGESLDSILKRNVRVKELIALESRIKKIPLMSFNYSISWSAIDAGQPEGTSVDNFSSTEGLAICSMYTNLSLGAPRSLGLYQGTDNGSLKELIFAKVGSYIMSDAHVGDPCPGCEKLSGFKTRVNAIFASFSSGKALSLGIFNFDSLESPNLAIKNFQNDLDRNGNRGQCYWREKGSKTIGRKVVGRRYQLSCEKADVNQIAWSNGSILVMIEGMQTKAELNLKAATTDDLIDFENSLPF